MGPAELSGKRSRSHFPLIETRFPSTGRDHERSRTPGAEITCGVKWIYEGVEAILMSILRTVLVGIMGVASIAGGQELAPWSVDTVYPLSAAPSDTGGPSVSMAINPENGRPVVAFLKGSAEPGTEPLMLLNYGEGPWDGWDYLGYDLGNAASDLDMDFWIDASIWKVGISYRDRTDQSLHFLESVYDRATGDLVATNMEIRDETSFNYGYGTSIRYDSAGTPHIAAQVRPVSLGLESLLYTVRVGSGGNCGVGTENGKWSCQPVHGYWNCGYVNYDLAAYDHSRPSVHFDKSSAATGIHVAFLATPHYSPGGPSLRHARWVGSTTGNCGYPLDWDCELDLPNELSTARGDSIEIGTNAAGLPVFAFPGAVSGEMAFIEYLGQNFAGNCGSIDRWYCGFLEQDSGTPNLVGEWMDLAVTAGGQPMVVYTKWHNSEAEYTLKLAYPWLFRDGFESGDAEVWSTSTP